MNKDLRNTNIRSTGSGEDRFHSSWIGSSEHEYASSLGSMRSNSQLTCYITNRIPQASQGMSMCDVGLVQLVFATRTTTVIAVHASASLQDCSKD